MLNDAEGSVQDENLDPSATGEPAQSEAKDTKDSGDAGDSGSKTPTLETLQAELSRMQSERDAAVMRLLDPDYQGYVEHKRSGGKREEAAPKVDPLAELDDEKVQAMTNRQLIETAVSIFRTSLKEEILPMIEQKLESVEDTVADVKTKREVAEAAEKYKDFWDYKTQMIALSNQRQYAHLSPEDVYLLAKGRTGRKAEAAPAKQPVGNDPNAQRSARASSEKPNVGAGSAGSSSTQKEMTAEEAGDAAWEKVFGKRK